MSGFADVLNSAMDEAHVTAAEVAESAGLTESAISLLRAGRREPNYRTLRRLIGVLPALAGELETRPNPFDSIEEAIADVRAGGVVVAAAAAARAGRGGVTR